MELPEPVTLMGVSVWTTLLESRYATVATFGAVPVVPYTWVEPPVICKATLFCGVMVNLPGA